MAACPETLPTLSTQESLPSCQCHQAEKDWEETSDYRSWNEHLLLKEALGQDDGRGTADELSLGARLKVPPGQAPVQALRASNARATVGRRVSPFPPGYRASSSSPAIAAASASSGAMPKWW